MRRFAKFFLFSAMVTAIGFAIWYYTQPEPVAIRVGAAEIGLVEQTVANTRAGTVKACRRTKLSPSIGGQIAVLDLREGDRVKSDQLLLELWNKDLAAKVTLAEREAEAAEAKARAACLNAENAEREAERQVKLRKRGVASEETVDRAITDSKAKQADCEAAQATARVHTARLGVARADLEKTRLVAPFAGIVAEISGELNEYVTPSPPGIPTPPAVDLIDDSCVYISAPIDEVDAPQINLDDAARVSLDAFGDRDFPGRVRRIAPYVLDLEKQARTVEIEVELTELQAGEHLLAGYSADVEIIVDRQPRVLRIPTEAIQDQDQVLVFTQEGAPLEERHIQTGLSNWDFSQVTSGLVAGELVVLSLDKEGVEAGVAAKIEQEDAP